ncbi:HTH-type transcriptional regulator RutR [Larsenimonas rhizosphaerae]|uniref:HTH-type transcriptional regulator RutR n=1 Tax=Larsenimonas rhizosphaerae TaxID=2944682 RepID=A0AA41ZLP6_9GAMM|nr:HTH-type transcriptional regulator RutR [Larsenimonas rhizosphaerae]MCM2129457.1 HTH-type transcriptional regulator RutR [Larsenimonas rhizosphaerae]MCX2524113.1 HTH-type transcriptional regulator RutR [Larsenimonas rhizosphaerae]
MSDRGSAAGGKRSADREVRMQRIRHAALTLFSRFGVRGTSLDAIAEQAGVSKTNLLYYFSSKEMLYISVMQQILDTWLAPMRAINADQAPADAIADYIRIKVELARDRADASRLFCLEMIQGAPLIKELLEQDLKALVEEKSAVINDWVASGRINPVEPHHLLYLLWGATQHYADFAVQIRAVSGQGLDDPAFFEATVQTIQDMVLGGLLPRSTP